MCRPLVHTKAQIKQIIDEDKTAMAHKPYQTTKTKTKIEKKTDQNNVVYEIKCKGNTEWQSLYWDDKANLKHKKNRTQYRQWPMYFSPLKKQQMYDCLCAITLKASFRFSPNLVFRNIFTMKSESDICDKDSC